MKRIFIGFLLIMFITPVSVWAQGSCKRYLGKSITNNEKILQDAIAFFGNRNEIQIFDSEVSLKRTYTFNLKDKKWFKDSHQYKQTHHEFTMIHLENIPGVRSFFKLLRLNILPQFPFNDFALTINFSDIISIEKNNNSRDVAFQSLLENNTLTVFAVNHRPRVDPQDPSNASKTMTVTTKWKFQKQTDGSIIILQSDTIFQRQDRRIVSGERYDFEIISRPNKIKSQVENVLDLYLERSNLNQNGTIYH